MLCFVESIVPLNFELILLSLCSIIFFVYTFRSEFLFSCFHVLEEPEINKSTI